MSDKKVKKEIKNIISRYLDLKKNKIFIFGSRTTGKARKFSDYDVGIMGKTAIPLATMAKIKDSFEESDLPYIVDVVDFATVLKDFKKEALKTAEYL